MLPRFPISVNLIIKKWFSRLSQNISLLRGLKHIIMFYEYNYKKNLATEKIVASICR